jgi:hypothetical protein
MISLVTRLGATALLASALPLSVMPANATLKPCQQGRTFGAGSGPSLDIAMKNAIQNWRIRTEAAYGSYFADYGLAEKSGRDCHRVGGGSLCRVWAQPCQSAKSS